MSADASSSGNAHTAMIAGKWTARSTARSGYSTPEVPGSKNCNRYGL